MIQSIRNGFNSVYNRTQEIFTVSAVVTGLASAVIFRKHPTDGCGLASVSAMFGTLAVSSGKADKITRTIAVIGAGTIPIALSLCLLVGKTRLVLKDANILVKRSTARIQGMAWR